MNRVAEIVTTEVLRAEKTAFIFRLVVTVVSYAGITIWLNAIRQSTSTFFLWLLIGVQLFLFLTIVVVSSLRMRACRKPAWWLWIPLILSRINDWELVAIPATMIVTVMLSETTKHISQEHSHLVPSDEGADAEIDRMRSEINRLQRDLELLEDPETICSFGQMAFDGDGVEQDYIEAAKWYQMATEQGHAGIQNNLGALYESGDGVLQDKMIALNLYRQAANGGDVNAVSNLSRLEALMNDKTD